MSRRRFQLSSTRGGSRCAIWSLALVAVGAAVASAQPLSTQWLQEIEANVLPPVLVEGPWQHEELPDYYLAENLELAFRFERARNVFESGQPRPYRTVTLIAGDAGVGKTFLKKRVFSKEYPAKEVCRFDVKDLYEIWESQGKVGPKPDLFCGDTVLCSLPALRDTKWQGLYDYLRQKSASFYVIDSLDEVHPDDYVSLLEQVDRFALKSDREFVHAVVLGRGIAFRDYWEKTSGHFPTSRLNLYMLEPPDHKTTGDLLVSSWNYHRFAHKLRWHSDPESDFSLHDFQQWATQDFAREGRFQDVACSPQDAIDARSEAALTRLVTSYRYPQSAFRNLAGNSFLREIVSQKVREGVGYDERAIMKEYFEKWLVRDTKSGNRPSPANPHHMKLYVHLLEEIAARVLREKRLDSYGFFRLHDQEMIQCNYEGRQMSFPAHRVLNRSGLKHLDPRTPGARRYRFEPIWLHRMLVDSYNRRAVSTTHATSAANRAHR
jgi:hypothetical protein